MPYKGAPVFNHNGCRDKALAAEARDKELKEIQEREAQERARAQAMARMEAQAENKRKREQAEFKRRAVRGRLQGAVAGVVKMGKALAAFKLMPKDKSKEDVKTCEDVPHKHHHKVAAVSFEDSAPARNGSRHHTPLAFVGNELALSTRNGSRHNTPGAFLGAGDDLKLATYPRSKSRQNTLKSVGSHTPGQIDEEEDDEEERELARRIEELKKLREKKEQDKKQKEKLERVAKLKAELQMLETEIDVEKVTESSDDPVRRSNRNPTLC